MSSKKIVAAVQTNKNYWYQNAPKGKLGPVLPKSIKKG